ncbi:MAG TPA: LysR family transcriptional regulator [Rhodopila sp.]|nr:LysR family transcriptional regulator [Rhodopila sp.]
MKAAQERLSHTSVHLSFAAALCRLQMLDWDDLRFFLSVARHKTLAAAAKHLQVTQSTVSRRLTSLQDGMGARLLVRTGDGYVPTLAGESIRAHVERVEAETLAVERAVAGHDERLEGLVRVASSQLLASHLLAPSFAALHALHGNILIEALPESTGDLTGRDVDIIVRLRRFESQELVVRRIGEIAFGLYGCVSYLIRHGHPDIAEGCPGHQLITRLTDYEGSAQSAWLAENAARAHITLKADSYETQLWAASCGGGLALLPRFRADAEPALRRLSTTVGVPSSEVWLGVHRENRQMPRVRIVLDLIAEAVRTRSEILNPAD